MFKIQSLVAERDRESTQCTQTNRLLTVFKPFELTVSVTVLLWDKAYITWSLVGYHNYSTSGN